MTNDNDLNMSITLHNEQPEPVLHNYTYWCDTVTVKVFSSGGKRAPTEESNKMWRCTIPNCMKLGLSEHLGGVTFPFGL